MRLLHFAVAAVAKRKLFVNKRLFDSALLRSQ